jgi:predicted AlkP superfamily pyrophosphatase or phosphodiesterase
MKKTLVTMAAVSLLTALSAGAAEPASNQARHVVLISVDGLHQDDLAWFIEQHPSSTLARLSHGGISFKNARTPFPSDSFPGMVGLVTGGNPRTTGIYYDDAYSRTLLPLGTTDCVHTPAGAEVQYAENVDKNPNRLDAGQNIPGLYNNFDLIAQLSSKPAKDLVDPAQLPVDPKTCKPVYPHEYIKVNTVFEVAHQTGLHTAWADKHAAYDILNGPSGLGIDDLFTPEINSSVTDPGLPQGPGPDFTKDNLDTQRYDALKVRAVLNWLAGHDHAGNGNPGVPAILGLNFQAVSTAQKLNLSHYLDSNTLAVVAGGLGGYVTDAMGHVTPGPVLRGALSFVDEQIGRLVQASDLNKAVFIVTAKHGQSPQSRTDLTIIDDGAMVDALNAAWAATAGAGVMPLVAHAMDDDGVLLWLSDHSQRAADFAGNFLQQYSGTGIGSDAVGAKLPKAFNNAGLRKIYAGREAAEFMGVRHSDDRVPDLIGIAKEGSVYGGTKLSKIAEHGGDAAQDRHVGLIVFGAGIRAAEVDEPVETTQVAPSILTLLGLSRHELKAVRVEGTRALPEIAR